jgi:hypothetical protein
VATVKVAHFTVVVTGLSEEVYNTTPDDSPDNGKWRMRVEEAVISYEWDRIVGYWRVVQTSVTGRSLSRKAPAPRVHTWPRGDGGKPVWVVALEHTHYPERDMDRKVKVL